MAELLRMTTFVIPKGQDAALGLGQFKRPDERYQAQGRDHHQDAALGGGPLSFDELFARAHHHREDPVFLGDTVLAWHLERMASEGLLKKVDDSWAATGEPR